VGSGAPRRAETSAPDVDLQVGDPGAQEGDESLEAFRCHGPDDGMRQRILAFDIAEYELA
jgi:hypothetical protein